MEDGTFASLIVLLLVVCFLGGFATGNGVTEASITTSHCQNVGYTHGKYDSVDNQIVCWNEIPEGLEE